jgi:antitoxin MazE
MRTTLRKVGNSQGVLIPSALLAECQLQGAVDMTVEAGKLVITPVRSPREGWFAGYQAEHDEDAWEGLALDADCGEWEW